MDADAPNSPESHSSEYSRMDSLASIDFTMFDHYTLNENYSYAKVDDMESVLSCDDIYFSDASDFVGSYADDPFPGRFEEESPPRDLETEFTDASDTSVFYESLHDRRASQESLSTVGESPPRDVEFRPHRSDTVETRSSMTTITHTRQRSTLPSSVISCLEVLVATFTECTEKNTITVSCMKKLITDLQGPVSKMLRELDPVVKDVGTKLEGFVISLTQTVIEQDLQVDNLDILFPLLEDGLRCLQTIDKGMYVWDVMHMCTPEFRKVHPFEPAAKVITINEHHVGGWSIDKPFEVWTAGSKPPHRKGNFKTIALERKTTRLVLRTSEMFATVAVIITHRNKENLVDRLFLLHALPKFIHPKSVAIKLLKQKLKKQLPECHVLCVSGRSEFVIDKSTNMDNRVYQNLAELGFENITLVDWGSSHIWVTDRGTIGSM